MLTVWEYHRFTVQTAQPCRDHLIRYYDTSDEDDTWMSNIPNEAALQYIRQRLRQGRITGSVVIDEVLSVENNEIYSSKLVMGCMCHNDYVSQINFVSLYAVRELLGIWFARNEDCHIVLLKTMMDMTPYGFVRSYGDPVQNKISVQDTEYPHLHNLYLEKIINQI